MSPTELVLRDPLGERALSGAGFPVSVGGPGHPIALPGAGADTAREIASCLPSGRVRVAVVLEVTVDPTLPA